MNKITAASGNVFRRIHDGMIFGNEIYLGIDYSTGEPREDKREYYEEIVEPINLSEPNDIVNTRDINTTADNTPKKTKIQRLFKRIFKWR